MKKRFWDYVKQGIEIVKLNQKAMQTAAKDKDALKMAIAVIALSGVAAAIGILNIPGIILLPIIALIGSFIGIGILHLLALLFGGKAKFGEFYRTMGLGCVARWVAVIPILGFFLSWLAGIWMMVISVFALKAVHKLSTAKAIIVVLIPVIIGFVFAAILMTMILTILAAGGFGAGAMSGMY